MKKFECYHGTSHEKFLKIKSNGFIVKPRSDHWLGNGIYFFLDDVDKAKWWSRNNPYTRNNPTVIKIIIKVLNENFLNLDVERDQSILDCFANEFRESLQELRISIPGMDEHAWHCMVIDAFVKENPGYKAIARTFYTDRPVGASGFCGVSRQLCIHDQSLLSLNNLQEISVRKTRRKRKRRSAS